MRAWTFLMLGWLTAALFACGGPQIEPGSPYVPITSLEQIVGKWEGLSKRMPEMRNHAEALLTISKTGHFNFVSDRGTGLLLGTGSLTLADGRALGTSSGGTGTLTLYEKAGRQILVVEAALNDGYHYYIEMTK
ncbi:MAG TPA: hypothetical protein VH681_01340 [Nitrospiraceae bacterium]